MHPHPSKVRGDYGHLPSGDPVTEMLGVGVDEVALRSTPLAIWSWSTYAIRLHYLGMKRSAWGGRRQLGPQRRMHAWGNEFWTLLRVFVLGTVTQTISHYIFAEIALRLYKWKLRHRKADGRAST